MTVVTSPRRAAALAPGLVVLGAILALVAFLSVTQGSRSIGLSEVLRALGGMSGDGSIGSTVTLEMRVPRTLLGILRSLGLRVSDAADGREGLAKARADLPDLVVTDVEMPFLNGLEMIAAMRDDASLRDVPVLVLTTRTDAPVRDRARALGVRGFLSKQRFVESELREMIDACLSR